MTAAAILFTLFIAGSLAARALVRMNRDASDLDADMRAHLRLGDESGIPSDPFQRED